jgi:hypothetical protein
VFVRIDVLNDPCVLADADTVANVRLKNLHRHYNLSIAESAARSAESGKCRIISRGGAAAAGWMANPMPRAGRSSVWV